MERAEDIRERARAFTDSPAQLRQPLAVRDAEGRTHSWFVPLVAREFLIGFVELSPDLTHLRTSSFQRRPGSYEGCPLAALWLDPEVVLETAANVMEESDTAGDPYLSFDQVPARLAWAVPVSGPNGEKTVYVAGAFTWVGSRSAGIA